MNVVMVRARAWQHAGQERVLSIGQVYDLPDAIALDLIATGAATREASDHAVVDTEREMAVAGPGETGKVRKRR